jgi:pilus assembly protein CpaF
MRVETMVAMTGMEIPSEFLRKYISSAINIIIHIARLADGTRKLTSLQEITGMEGNMITMQEIFSFQQTGVDADGKVKGRFKFHGVRPKFIERFKVADIHISNSVFDPTKSMEV